MKKSLSLVFIAVSFATHAAEPNLGLLKANLNTWAEIKGVKLSQVPGLYEVQINSDVVYMTEDGEKIFSGDLYDLKQGISYTERAKNALRKDALASVKDDDKIIFKAKDEQFKVTVFTDISCPYCTKLHQHMTEFNDAGITIEYLAFPRAGIGSENEREMQNIWCSENKTQALTDAKIKQIVPAQSCSGNQAAAQFLLGQEIGVNATPTMIFDDGEIVPGYMKPANLLAILKEKSEN